MADFENFDVLFASDRSFAYGEQTITQILKSRRAAHNELLIDKLLKTLGVARRQYAMLFPVRSLVSTDTEVRL